MRAQPRAIVPDPQLQHPIPAEGRHTYLMPSPFAGIIQHLFKVLGFPSKRKVWGNTAQIELQGALSVDPLHDSNQPLQQRQDRTAQTRHSHGGEYRPENGCVKRESLGRDEPKMNASESAACMPLG